MSQKSQLENSKYKNWVRGGLAYKYLKEGLVKFTDDVIQREHTRILGVVTTTSGNACNQCNLMTLQPLHIAKKDQTGRKICPWDLSNCNCLYSGKTPCPNNICDVIMEEILKSHRFTPPAPNWKNINVQKLYTSPWEIAKCFINAPGYSDKTSAADIDAFGLLTCFINNKNLHAHLSCNMTGNNIFIKCQERRNKLFHSPQMELEDAELEECIADIIELLEDPKELAETADAQQAVLKLKQLMLHDFIITTQNEVSVSKDAVASITTKTGELVQMIQEANDDIDKCVRYTQRSIWQDKSIDDSQLVKTQKMEKLTNVEEKQDERLEQEKKELQSMLILREDQIKDLTFRLEQERKEKGKDPQNENQRPNEKLFQSFYSYLSAREEESRQFPSPLSQNTAPPGGNFIDTRELPLKETVFDSSVRVDASYRVCMICFPGGTGTGFRVGTKYIMTAKHVVSYILNKEYPAVGQNNDQFAELQADGVYALFSYIKEGPQTEEQKFRFKAIVHFYDDNTDTAVLELEDAVGTTMPPSFTYFSLPKLDGRFTFIGHSEGKPKEFNHVDKIIDINSEQTKRDIDQMNQKTLQILGKVSASTLANTDRYLFHCMFTKGASGSPGVVILGDGRVVVVTMLLCGHPDWYYEKSVPDYFKDRWHKEDCVEQGVNMKYVQETMLKTNRSLCCEIFNYHTDSLPNPTI